MDPYATFWLTVGLAAFGWVAFKHYQNKWIQQQQWRLEEIEEGMRTNAANDNGST